ncbi:hypothetical protein HY440_02710 [Candidatus Microgenomates bacterium]|nr:hypothetical protein [Candidatus Microgenomates bacterium]
MKVRVNKSDLSKILKHYSNAWVALDSETMSVAVTGKNPSLVLEKARKKGLDHPVLTRVPKDYGSYIL